MPQTAFGWRRAAALFVILVVTIPASRRVPRSSGDQQQTGSIQGTISTTLENAASGLAGISVKPTTAPLDGNTQSADTDDAERYEFNSLKPGKYTISITPYEVNASYIWSRRRGDLNNLSDVLIPFLQPVIRPNVYGVLPAGVPHRVVTWGVSTLPKKFPFSPILDLHSGYP